MNNWLLLSANKQINQVEDFPNHENLVGFIYKITNTKTGKFYIGQKSLYYSRKTRISKKEKAETATRKVFKVVKKESDWKIYHGSSADLKADVKKHGAGIFKREILELCCTKKYLGYCELKYMIEYDVLNADSYNGNILGRYFSKDMENCY